MTIYMKIDAEGFPKGFWDSNAYGERGDPEHPETVIPAGAIQITAKQHEEFLSNQGARQWNSETKQINQYDPPPRVVTPEEQRKIDFPNLHPDQFWFGLRAAGYEDDVREWVASLNDPDSPDYDPVVWAWASSKLEFATFFERDHPLVLAAQQAIGISEAELDTLWSFAAQ